MASKENQEALDFIKKAEPYLPNALVRLVFVGKTIAIQQVIDDLELYKKALEIIIKKILCVSNEQYEQELKYWLEKAERKIKLEKELENGNNSLQRSR